MTPAGSACILVLLDFGSGRWGACGRNFFGRRRLLVPENREVGAVHAAQIATAALLRVDHVRSVISLGVESRGERQNMRGTELYAESAGLTALNHNLHRTLGHCCPFFLAPRRRKGSLDGGIFLVRLGGDWNYAAVGSLIHLPNDSSILNQALPKAK